MITAIIISLTEKFYSSKLVFSAVTFIFGFITDAYIIKLLYKLGH